MWGYNCGFLNQERRFDRKGGFNSDAAVIDEIIFSYKIQNVVFLFLAKGKRSAKISG